jgi:hypothetical protein
MAKKFNHVNNSIVTRDMQTMAFKSGNVYASISILSQRAAQIASQMKEELNNKLADFVSKEDNLEEIFENKEQIEISKYYERLPKPSSISIDEMMADELVFRKKEELND